MIFLSVLETNFAVSRPIDDELISKIALGDTDALHTLYESISSAIFGFVLSITKNTHDAEDALQETFLSVYQKAVDYKPSGKPMAWIFVIAKNHALAKLRQHSKVQLATEEDAEIGITLSDIDNREARMVLEEAFKILSDDERNILMLHAVGGFKHREIAQILNISLNTVLSKYHRAVKKMKVQLEVDYGK